MIKKFLTRIAERFRKKEYIQDILYGEKDLKYKQKKRIASLIAREEFRDFEVYLQIKQRGKAKRLLTCEEKEMPLLRRDISMLAEITADMSRFWGETHKPTVTVEKKEKVTLFGKNKLKL